MSALPGTTPGASSVDGRTFGFHATDGRFVPGDLVVLDPESDGSLIGQVLDVDAEGCGSGQLLGRLLDDGAVVPADRRPFAGARVQPAVASQLEQLQRVRHADLPVGTWMSGGAEVPARLRTQGFARHTFLCGQSGSGKTYALGVVLERLLLATELRMVVLDPNADFVGMGRPRPDAPEGAARQLQDVAVRVLGAGTGAPEPLRMRFMTMARQAQAAVLQLDPLADRAEYNDFLHLMADGGPRSVGDVVRQLRLGGPGERALAQRIENLGLLEWDVWAGDLPSAYEVVQAGARLTVLDLSGFRTPQEPLAVSLDLVEGLWQARESRTPTLIVLDEAHNLCPGAPSGSLQAALVDRLVQIAAEGRKYGLWLLLSTQRPSKVHPQVLSQCDNLLLMRMNSPGDIAELAEVFGFAPAAMLRSSTSFAQGELLVAGGFVPVASQVRIGGRLTVEGGRDVPVPV